MLENKNNFKLNKGLKFSHAPIDVLFIGEILVDIVKENLNKSTINFGGSPANIAVNIKKLGHRPHLISKIGDDKFGKFLLKKLAEYNISTKNITIDREHKTTYVVVEKSQDSPNFIPFRGAEKYLETDDIDKSLINKTKIVHLSAFSLSVPQNRKTLMSIIKQVKDKDKILSLDPNYRHKLWQGNGNGDFFIRKILKYIDIVKPSIDDAKAIFGSHTYMQYIKKFHNEGTKLVILTDKDGALVSTGNQIKKYKTYAKNVIDATGAGDAFWAGFYSSLISGNNISYSIKMGNVIASYALKKTGAIPNMPSRETLNSLI